MWYIDVRDAVDQFVTEFCFWMAVVLMVALALSGVVLIARTILP